MSRHITYYSSIIRHHQYFREETEYIAPVYSARLEEDAPIALFGESNAVEFAFELSHIRRPGPIGPSNGPTANALYNLDQL